MEVDYPLWLTLTVCSVYFISGLGSLLPTKFMNTTDAPRCDDPIDPYCEAVPYNGPFFQTFICTAAGLMFVIVYFVDWLANIGFRKRKLRKAARMGVLVADGNIPVTPVPGNRRTPSPRNAKDISVTDLDSVYDAVSVSSLDPGSENYDEHEHLSESRSSLCLIGGDAKHENLTPYNCRIPSSRFDSALPVPADDSNDCELVLAGVNDHASYDVARNTVNPNLAAHPASETSEKIPNVCPSDPYARHRDARYVLMPQSINHIDDGDGIIYNRDISPHMVLSAELGQMAFEFNKPGDLHKPLLPMYFLLMPAISDTTASVVINMAYLLAPASTVEIIRNLLIVFSAFFALTILKQHLFYHQLVGITVMVTGMVTCGLVLILSAEESDSAQEKKGNPVLGIILALIGSLATSLNFTVEAKFYRNYYMPPLRAQAIQGFLGVLIATAICAVVYTRFTSVEQLDSVLHQVSSSNKILFNALLLMFSTAMFRASGLVTTLMTSALLRSILMSSRVVIVYFVELGMGWQTFNVINFFGIVLCLLGFALYVNVTPRRAKEKWSWLRAADDWSLKTFSLSGQTAFVEHHTVESIPFHDAVTVAARHHRLSRNGVMHSNNNSSMLRQMKIIPYASPRYSSQLRLLGGPGDSELVYNANETSPSPFVPNTVTSDWDSPRFALPIHSAKLVDGTSPTAIDVPQGLPNVRKDVESPSSIC